MYIGNRHARIRGEQYDEFIEAYVKTVTTLFPNVLLQWEDFTPGNGRRILETYRNRICTFNDDMQGTGAITLAAVISAVRASGKPLRAQRVVIFGAGTAGIGIADELRDAMMMDGLSRQEATGRFWCVDKPGLLISGVVGKLHDYQVPYARPASEGGAWASSLAGVVHKVQPTILIGASAAAGSFTEEIIRDMAAHAERPVILVISTPPARAEANPTDLITWTDGRGLVATGAPFSPVTYKGVTYVIGQINNAMLYPGLALGAIVSGASRITNGMLSAAAHAVSSLVTVRQPGSSLLPLVDDLRSVSATVAAAVAEAAVLEGMAGLKCEDIVQQVQNAMWQPEYQTIKAV
jgi:malate dehydrogenase (oxaloacetate-decarboxylating)